MFASMRKPTAGILLALPVLGSAEPIYVDYETRIADDCACDQGPYAPGERFAGWLRIDPDLAPPNRFPPMPGQQLHGSYGVMGPPGVDFVRGLGWPTLWFGDHVSVVDDDAEHRHQSYSIWDYSLNPKGGSTLLQLQLGSNDQLDDFIHGIGLEQSFDTETMKGDLDFRGFLTHNVMGVLRTFRLVLERLSVTPGRCRAP